MNQTFINSLIGITTIPVLLLQGCQSTQEATQPPVSSKPTVAPTVVQDSWQTFTPKSGSYSVSMPAKPTERVQTTTSPDGSLSAQMHVALLSYQSCQLGVMYSEYPQEANLPDDPQQALNGSRDSLIKTLKAKLLDEKQLSQDGHPGREIKLTAPDGSIIQTRLYLVKRSMYQAMTISPGTPASSAIVSRFLDSFKFKS
jgi:hypothetical protein